MRKFLGTCNFRCIILKFALGDLRPTYTCNFHCDFLLLTDVNKWTSYECMVKKNPLIHIRQKEKIAQKIAVKVASVNGPLYWTYMINLMVIAKCSLLLSSRCIFCIQHESCVEVLSSITWVVCTDNWLALAFIVWEILCCTAANRASCGRSALYFDSSTVNVQYLKYLIIKIITSVHLYIYTSQKGLYSRAFAT